MAVGHHDALGPPSPPRVSEPGDFRAASLIDQRRRRSRCRRFQQIRNTVKLTECHQVLQLGARRLMALPRSAKVSARHHDQDVRFGVLDDIGLIVLR